MVSELETIEELYRLALASIAGAAGTVSRVAWDSLDVAGSAAAAVKWMGQTDRAIAAGRSKAYRLSVAYYRYARAVDTGETVPLPEFSPNYGTRPTISMGSIRQEFLDLLVDLSAMDREPTSHGAGVGTEETFEKLLREAVASGANTGATALGQSVNALLDTIERNGAPDGAVVRVDHEFEWTPISFQVERFGPPANSTKRKGRERRTGEAAQPTLRDYVLKYHKQLTGELAGTDEPTGSLVRASKKSRFGVVASGAADWAVMDGAAAALRGAAHQDRQFKTWFRITSDSPCHFCAMLAGRADGYHNENTASFHPHSGCHCTAVARWSDDSSQNVPPLNKWLSENWSTAMNEGEGKNALNQWRNWYAAQVAAGNVPSN